MHVSSLCSYLALVGQSSYHLGELDCLEGPLTLQGDLHVDLHFLRPPGWA